MAIGSEWATGASIVSELWPDLKPGVLGAVDLYEFAQAIAPPTRLMRRGKTMPSVLPQPIGDHPTAQGFARH